MTSLNKIFKGLNYRHNIRRHYVEPIFLLNIPSENKKRMRRPVKLPEKLQLFYCWYEFLSNLNQRIVFLYNFLLKLLDKNNFILLTLQIFLYPWFSIAFKNKPRLSSAYLIILPDMFSD